MAKTNSWANRTKEAASAIGAEDLAGLRPVGSNGGGTAFEAVTTYYQYNAPKEASDRSKKFETGMKFLGAYQGSFTTKGKFPKIIHKVKTAEGLVGLTGCGQLNKLLDQVPAGSKVLIQYRGKSEIAKGQYAGNMAHTFDVSSDSAN